MEQERLTFLQHILSNSFIEVVDLIYITNIVLTIRIVIVLYCFNYGMFNVTFNNISAMSWRSILLVEEAKVPGENHPAVTNHWQTLLHNVVSGPPLYERYSN